MYMFQCYSLNLFHPPFPLSVQSLFSSLHFYSCSVNRFTIFPASVYMQGNCWSLSCVRLCNPMDCSSPGSSVHGILQARTLEWAAFPSPGDLPHPGVQCESSTLAGGFFITSATWEALLSHLSLIKSPRGGLYGQYFVKQLSRTQVNHSPQITELVSSRTIICIQGCLTPKPNVFTSRKDNLC